MQTNRRLLIAGESPKKKQKISLQRLKMASAGPRYVRIGKILKKPEVKERTVVQGELRTIKIRCICTDNRVGRLPITDKGKDGLRFLYIADATGFMSVGMNAAECGLTKLIMTKTSARKQLVCYFVWK